MAASDCSPLYLQENSPFLFDYNDLLDKTCDPAAYDSATDPGYFSACSSLSPTSSVDSFCFSPTSLQGSGNGQDAFDCFFFSSPAEVLQKQNLQTAPCPDSTAAPTYTSTATRKSKSRYPGKKRQTASEREKLRMRDLTKALHHLRTYLPTSVAPAGQTLTKIETLRLTIRYISYLSAQLGLSEETLVQRKSSGAVEQPQTLTEILQHPAASCSPQEICSSVWDAVDETCMYQQNIPIGQFSTLQNSYLVPNDVCSAPSTSQRYWMSTQQQHQQCHLSGQR